MCSTVGPHENHGTKGKCEEHEWMESAWTDFGWTVWEPILCYICSFQWLGINAWMLSAEQEDSGTDIYF